MNISVDDFRNKITEIVNDNEGNYQGIIKDIDDLLTGDNASEIGDISIDDAAEIYQDKKMDNETSHILGEVFTIIGFNAEGNLDTSDNFASIVSNVHSKNVPNHIELFINGEIDYTYVRVPNEDIKDIINDIKSGKVEADRLDGIYNTYIDYPNNIELYATSEEDITELKYSIIENYDNNDVTRKVFENLANDGDENISSKVIEEKFDGLDPNEPMQNDDIGVEEDTSDEIKQENEPESVEETVEGINTDTIEEDADIEEIEEISWSEWSEKSAVFDKIDNISKSIDSMNDKDSSYANRIVDNLLKGFVPLETRGFAPSDNTFMSEHKEFRFSKADKEAFSSNDNTLKDFVGTKSVASSLTGADRFGQFMGIDTKNIHYLTRDDVKHDYSYKREEAKDFKAELENFFTKEEYSKVDKVYINIDLPKDEGYGFHGIYVPGTDHEVQLANFNPLELATFEVHKTDGDVEYKTVACNSAGDVFAEIPNTGSAEIGLSDGTSHCDALETMTVKMSPEAEKEYKTTLEEFIETQSNNAMEKACNIEADKIADIEKEYRADFKDTIENIDDFKSMVTFAYAEKTAVMGDLKDSYKEISDKALEIANGCKLLEGMDNKSVEFADMKQKVEGMVEDYKDIAKTFADSYDTTQLFDNSILTDAVNSYKEAHNILDSANALAGQTSKADSTDMSTKDRFRDMVGDNSGISNIMIKIPSISNDRLSQGAEFIKEKIENWNERNPENKLSYDEDNNKIYNKHGVEIDIQSETRSSDRTFNEDYVEDGATRPTADKDGNVGSVEIADFENSEDDTVIYKEFSDEFDILDIEIDFDTDNLLSPIEKAYGGSIDDLDNLGINRETVEEKVERAEDITSNNTENNQPVNQPTKEKKEYDRGDHFRVQHYNKEGKVELNDTIKSKLMAEATKEVDKMSPSSMTKEERAAKIEEIYNKKVEVQQTKIEKIAEKIKTLNEDVSNRQEILGGYASRSNHKLQSERYDLDKLYMKYEKAGGSIGKESIVLSVPNVFQRLDTFNSLMATHHTSFITFIGSEIYYQRHKDDNKEKDNVTKDNTDKSDNSTKEHVDKDNTVNDNSFINERGGIIFEHSSQDEPTDVIAPLTDNHDDPLSKEEKTENRVEQEQTQEDLKENRVDNEKTNENNVSDDDNPNTTTDDNEPLDARQENQIVSDEQDDEPTDEQNKVAEDEKDETETTDDKKDAQIEEQNTDNIEKTEPQKDNISSAEPDKTEKSDTTGEEKQDKGVENAEELQEKAVENEDKSDIDKTDDKTANEDVSKGTENLTDNEPKAENSLTKDEETASEEGKTETVDTEQEPQEQGNNTINDENKESGVTSEKADPVVMANPTNENSDIEDDQSNRESLVKEKIDNFLNSKDDLKQALNDELKSGASADDIMTDMADALQNVSLEGIEDALEKFADLINIGSEVIADATDDKTASDIRQDLLEKIKDNDNISDEDKAEIERIALDNVEKTPSDSVEVSGDYDGTSLDEQQGTAERSNEEFDAITTEAQDVAAGSSSGDDTKNEVTVSDVKNDITTDLENQGYSSSDASAIADTAIQYDIDKGVDVTADNYTMSNDTFQYALENYKNDLTYEPDAVGTDDDAGEMVGNEETQTSDGLTTVDAQDENYDTDKFEWTYDDDYDNTNTDEYAYDPDDDEYGSGVSNDSGSE